MEIEGHEQTAATTTTTTTAAAAAAVAPEATMAVEDGPCVLLPFSHSLITKATMPNAVTCSDSNDLAFITDSCVYVTSAVLTARSSSSSSSSTSAAVNSQSKQQSTIASLITSSIASSALQNVSWKYSCGSNFYIDERLPALQSHSSTAGSTSVQHLMDASAESYTNASWSPPGCSPVAGSGCLLCVCGGPRHHAVVLHTPPMSVLGTTLVELADLTELTYRHFAPEWGLDQEAYPSQAELAAAPQALLDLICPEDEKKSGSGSSSSSGSSGNNSKKAVLRWHSEAGHGTSCANYSEYALRTATLLPRCSAWSPLVSLGAHTVTLLAVASKLVVSVFLYAPFEDTKEFTFASFFRHENSDVIVTSLSFSPCSRAEDLRLAIGFSDGTVDLYRAEPIAATLSSPAAHDVKLTFASVLRVGKPCRRHVTSICWFSRPKSSECEVSQGRCLAFARARSLCVWDETSNQTANVTEAHHEILTGITYSPSKAILYTSSIDGTIRSWNVLFNDNNNGGGSGGYSKGVLRVEGGAVVYSEKGPVMGVACSVSGALAFALTAGRGPMRKSTFEKRITSTCFGVALSTDSSVSICAEMKKLSGPAFADFCAAAFGSLEQSDTVADALCDVLVKDVVCGGCGCEVLPKSLQFAYAVCSFMAPGNEHFRERCATLEKRIVFIQSTIVNKIVKAKSADSEMSLGPLEALSIQLHAKTLELFGSGSDDDDDCMCFDLGETCFVCGEKIEFGSVKMGVCPKGHAFRRCAITRLLIKPSAAAPMARCVGCGSASLNSGSFVIYGRSMTWSCPFCGGPFTLT